MPSTLMGHDQMGEDRAIANALTSLGVCVCLWVFFCVYTGVDLLSRYDGCDNVAGPLEFLVHRGSLGTEPTMVAE